MSENQIKPNKWYTRKGGNSKELYVIGFAENGRIVAHNVSGDVTFYDVDVFSKKFDLYKEPSTIWIAVDQNGKVNLFASKPKLNSHLISKKYYTADDKNYDKLNNFKERFNLLPLDCREFKLIELKGER